MRRTITLCSLVLILAGCGQMPAAEPTAPPTSAPAVATPAASPVPAELTLGDLAARVNAAWPTVRSYRITFTGLAPAQAAAAHPPRRHRRDAGGDALAAGARRTGVNA